MLHLKRNLLLLFLFLSAPIYSDINKNPFELIDVKSQEMVVVLKTENELFNTNPEIFKDKIKDIFEPLIDFNRVSGDFSVATKLLPFCKNVVKFERHNT